jgi:uncharacterized membrane protein YhiD involved in acid resistance
MEDLATGASSAIGTIAGSGLLGALLVIAMFGLVMVYRQNQALHSLSREDRGEVVRALLEASVAQKEVSRVVEKNNELITQVIYRNNNGGAQ